jgi:hypothetical protein
MLPSLTLIDQASDGIADYWRHMDEYHKRRFYLD